MQKIKVIKHEFLPTKLPITFTIALFLLLDRLGASAFAYGVAATVMVILLALGFVRIYAQQERAPMWQPEGMEE